MILKLGCILKIRRKMKGVAPYEKGWDNDGQ